MRKIFLIVFLFSFLIFSSYGGIEDDLKESLKKANTMIELLADKNDVLTFRNEAINKKYLKTKEEIKELTAEIKELTAALKKSNEFIKKSAALTIKYQEEIDGLRTTLSECSDSLVEIKYWGLGIAATYPWGGQLLIGFDIPETSIGIFGTVGLHTDTGMTNFEYLFGLGFKIKFWYDRKNHNHLF